MHPVDFRTDRLVLDQLTIDDAERVAATCSQPIFERFMTTPWPYERAHAEGFITEVVPLNWAEEAEATWAIRLADASLGSPAERLAGVIGVMAPSMDVGCWLAEGFRGHGIMTEAVPVVARWALDTRFGGVTELYWQCVAGNHASAAVARRAGFRFVGWQPARHPNRDGAHPLMPTGRWAPDDADAAASWDALEH
ncbi:N-acetyltransferase [Gulosibacter macacae]|uniref:N-acetyltransferase n=1 Tax=Gulosibacter macacae TaxID=2488791 RepID=A0A3P3VYE6_9MICO|nr:GNAT family N-acetyltransferase [Gulosibacter macacae]RRJ87068.1 N-acetyltransferase [Gulosibacter macacae]